MTEPRPEDAAEDADRAFDPAPIAARVRSALDGYLRERAPDQRLAFWKAVALGYGGSFESLAGCPMPQKAGTES